MKFWQKLGATAAVATIVSSNLPAHGQEVEQQEPQAERTWGEIGADAWTQIKEGWHQVEPAAKAFTEHMLDAPEVVDGYAKDIANGEIDGVTFDNKRASDEARSAWDDMCGTGLRPNCEPEAKELND